MDHSGKEKEALALMAEADKKMKTTRSMLGTLFGSSRLEEACELYVRAANMFKMAKNWNAAGEAFCRAAQLYRRGDSKHNAATCFLDAGNAFRKEDAQEAVLCFGQAIDIYTDLGRFNMAAKHHTTVADIWESELLDIEKAASHYEQAADYYRGEESSSAANKCLLKVGIFAAQLEQYQKAIEIFEQIGTYSMDTTLLKYAAKDHFFKAALCHFCVDMLNCKLAVQRYEQMFPAFSDARECRLLKIQEFESITRLEQWHSALLLRIQSSIPDESNLR